MDLRALFPVHFVSCSWSNRRRRDSTHGDLHQPASPFSDADWLVSRTKHYELKLREMDEEVRRHEHEHERLLSDLEALEKKTEVVVKARPWMPLRGCFVRPGRERRSTRCAPAVGCTLT